MNDAVGTRTTAGSGKRAGRRPSSKVETKTINLALQGGGAHGAFTWGVIDRLLEDERIGIEAVSATSAGAVNAVVMAYGIAEGGREGGRKALTNFWRRISHAGALSPLQPTLLDRMLGNLSLENSPAFMMFDILSRVLSPYQLNPLNFNPLRSVLEQSVDFERLRTHCCPVKLFLSATNVRTGKIKVFGNDELTADTVLASSCLPFLFQAVEIGGEHYWDGGYMGNPAIFPLIYNCTSADVVLVHVNPLEREALPWTATEILNRINEITFNSSLMREMRAINFVTRLIDEGDLDTTKARRMLIHAIAADETMSKLSVASKFNPDWDFLLYLHEIGRSAAGLWLEQNFDRLNIETTIDLRNRYL